MEDSQLRGMVDPFTLIGEAAGNLGFSAIGTFRLRTITTNLAHAALITSGFVKRGVLAP